MYGFRFRLLVLIVFSICLYALLVYTHQSQKDLPNLEDEIALHLAVTDIDSSYANVVDVSKTSFGKRYTVWVDNPYRYYYVECIYDVSSRQSLDFYMAILHKEKPYYVSKQGTTLTTCWHSTLN